MFKILILSLIWLVSLTGCYNVALNPISPVSGSLIPINGRLEVPRQTADYTYDVRSAAAGYGNRFRIHVGKALAQYAKAYIDPVFVGKDNSIIRIVIENFDVHDFEAHIDASFLIEIENEMVFNKKYHANGTGYFAQTLWAGVFAMKSSMRKTLNEALRSLFEQFLEDASIGYREWTIKDLDAPALPADTFDSDDNEYYTPGDTVDSFDGGGNKNFDPKQPIDSIDNGYYDSQEPIDSFDRIDKEYSLPPESTE